MIEVENPSKRYGEKLAAGGLDFVVRPGIVTGFFGPNGAGKPATMPAALQRFPIAGGPCPQTNPGYPNRMV